MYKMMGMKVEIIYSGEPFGYLPLNKKSFTQLC